MCLLLKSIHDVVDHQNLRGFRGKLSQPLLTLPRCEICDHSTLFIITTPTHTPGQRIYWEYPFSAQLCRLKKKFLILNTNVPNYHLKDQAELVLSYTEALQILQGCGGCPVSNMLCRPAQRTRGRVCADASRRVTSCL